MGASVFPASKAARMVMAGILLAAMGAVVWAVSNVSPAGPAAKAAVSGAAAGQGMQSTPAFVSFTVNGTTLDGETVQQTSGGVDYSSGWSNLLSMTESMGMASTDTARASRLTAQPFTVVKRVDQATPLLMQATAENSTVEVKVHLHGQDPETGETRHEVTYLLGGARIVGRQVGPSATDGFYAETISLAYRTLEIHHEIESIEYTYTPTAVR